MKNKDGNKGLAYKYLDKLKKPHSHFMGNDNLMREFCLDCLPVFGVREVLLLHLRSI